MVVMLSDGSRLTGRTLHPLPDLDGLDGFGVNDNVLTAGLRDLLLNLASGGIVRHHRAGWQCKMVSHHPLLVGDRGERISGAVLNRDEERLRVPVPAQLLRKQPREVEVTQAVESSRAV